MTKLFNVLFFIFLCTIAFSQEFKKISDPSKCKSAIQKQQKLTRSLIADFKETLHSEMFEETQKATGKLYYKQAQKIRWEHISPVKKILLIDGNKVRYSEKGKEIKDPSTKAIVKKIQSLMVKMLSGTFLDDKDFKISYYENSSQYKLELKPLSQRMSKYIDYVVLVFDKKYLQLKEMSLVESENEKLVYSFSNVLLNNSISDIKFSDFK
jgi:outer membrane lipoprotein-sorting protein